VQGATALPRNDLSSLLGTDKRPMKSMNGGFPAIAKEKIKRTNGRKSTKRKNSGFRASIGSNISVEKINSRSNQKHDISGNKD